MGKIEKLTKKQMGRMAEFVDKWTAIGLSTEPANRPAAEAAIVKTYAAAKLPAPRVVWCGSPLSQGLTRATVAQIAVRASVRDSVDASVYDSVLDSVLDSVGDSVYASVRDSVAASVAASVRDSVAASVGASVRDSVRDSVAASVRDSVAASVGASVRDSVAASVAASVRDSVAASVAASVRDSVRGQHEAGWVAFYDFFRVACGLESQTAPLLGLMDLCASAGWALPHAGLCWVSERHSSLRRDAGGRLHSESTAAVEYPDGWKIWAWHGTRVPGEWIENRGSLGPRTALTWSNVEQRRAAAEILGWSRILAELRPRIVDTDPDALVGQLLEVDLPDSPACRFLKVKCGTGRDFVLPVPREMKTALQANCWTYEVDSKTFNLSEVRT